MDVEAPGVHKRQRGQAVVIHIPARWQAYSKVHGSNATVIIHLRLDLARRGILDVNSLYVVWGTVYRERIKKGFSLLGNNYL